MYARVSRYSGDPERLVAEFGNPPSGVVEPEPGYIGVYSLVDREHGRAITLTLWETEEAMQATAEEANRLREELNRRGGGISPATVETYEVVMAKMFQEDKVKA